jgi:hypothetical protein
MTSEYGQKVFDWISSRDQERADCERAYALRGLMDSAPSAAFRMLCSMRGSPTKEQRERLASVLANVPEPIIAHTLAGQEKEYEVRKAVELLLIAAQEPKADRNSRAAILEGVSSSIEKFQLDIGTIGAELRKNLEAILATLDASSAVRLRGLIHKDTPQQQPQDVAPRDPTEVIPQTTGSHEPAVRGAPLDPHRVAEPVEQDETSEPSGVGPPKPDPLAWFDANIQMLAHAREFYLAARREAEAARADAEAERKRREEVETRIADSLHLPETVSQADARNRALEAQLSVTTHERDLAKSELAKAASDLQSERELRLSKEREMEGFAQERQNLQRRIDINAEARLRDYRIALSAALKPLLQDIPAPGSERAAELVDSLLVRVDHIIRTLSENGVELRHSAGGER